MKKFALALVGLAALFANSGCNTVAYSAKERGQMIARNWDLEYRMIQDDIDMVLLLRPVSSLTTWHVR
jgi:hypothetical protein